MSSEQEEGADHLDEQNGNSDANADPSEDQKGNGLREHAKPRRRRRGKKRKQKKESAATCEAENPEECESELHVKSEHDSPEWGSDESLSCNYDAYTDVIIRPVNVPMAPLNSTQFIMDDHDDCRFYMSFETPNPYGVSAESHLDREDGDIIEPIGEDAAYIDIDYQYESPQDFDNSAYYDKEFELSYKNNRFEELMRLTRTDLINRLQTLESRFKELSEDLVKENPSPILEKLQGELLELQEKNIYLKECNSKLTTVLLQNESDCSETLTCPTLGENASVSRESEDSDREVYEECNETVVDEVIMSDAISNTQNEACDKNSDVHFRDNQQNDYNEEESNRLVNHNEDSIQRIDHNEEVDQLIDENTDQQNASGENKLASKKLGSGECTSSGTAINNSEDKKSKLIHSNSHVMLCQSNNLVSDDLRTLNITSSELFHIANQTKCSSLVPREGGMSPSETSVN